MIDARVGGVAERLRVDPVNATNPWFPTSEQLLSTESLVLLLVNLIWSDTHLYFTHLALHRVPILYQRIHKVHHESFNPDTFSGLSFHPVEGLIYFSSTLVFFIYPGGYPIWGFHVHRLAMILAPIAGHTGHSPIDFIPGEERPFTMADPADHWIHHTKL